MELGTEQTARTISKHYLPLMQEKDGGLVLSLTISMDEDIIPIRVPLTYIILYGEAIRVRNI
jgi:hypothetical protein